MTATYDAMRSDEAAAAYTAEINRMTSVANQLQKELLDDALDIDNLQRFVVGRGGVLNSANNAYDDMTHAGSRANTAMEYFEREKVRPLVDTMRIKTKPNQNTEKHFAAF